MGRTARRATGLRAWLQPSALAALVLLAGCTSPARPTGESADPGRPGGPSGPSGCGPVRYGEVTGRAPSYAEGPLARWANDHAMCAGVWLPGADDWLVPQGMAVADGTAYVAGFDGTQAGRHRLCTVESVSLRTGEVVARRYPVRGQVGPREPTECRHGGGVLVDEHGVWLAETQRLWLLDPTTFEVRRGWALLEPVRGSFAAWGRRGELGLGRFSAHHEARMWWFDTEGLLASSAYEIGRDDAPRWQVVPPATQGAVWGRLGGVGPGMWFATSTASCGVLVGPDGRRRAFVPGAESMSLVGRDRLWVVSESGSRLYQDKGRPLTPMLARFDTSGIAGWAAPDCSV